VPLPERWLRGFAEVQVLAARFDLRAELAAAEGLRFLRALPAGAHTGAALWAVPAGRSLRLASRPVPGAVCVPGPQRLQAVAPLLRHARALRAYGPVVAVTSRPTASAWELVLEGMRLLVMVSPEPYRGFSGEGAVLEALASDQVDTDADLVGALLAFEPRVEVDLLAERSGRSWPRPSPGCCRRQWSGRREGFPTCSSSAPRSRVPSAAAMRSRSWPRSPGVAARADWSPSPAACSTSWPDRHTRRAGYRPLSSRCGLGHCAQRSRNSPGQTRNHESAGRGFDTPGRIPPCATNGRSCSASQPPTLARS